MLVSEVVPGVRDGIDADMGEKLDLERLSPRKLLDLVDEPTYRERERESERERETGNRTVDKAHEVLQIAGDVPRRPPGNEALKERGGKQETIGRTKKETDTVRVLLIAQAEPNTKGLEIFLRNLLRGHEVIIERFPKFEGYVALGVVRDLYLQRREEEAKDRKGSLAPSSFQLSCHSGRAESLKSSKRLPRWDL